MKPCRELPLLFTLFIAGCAASSTEVRRLSPSSAASTPPIECRIISVFRGSPAEKAGIRTGDRLLKVNGKTPADATGMSELILQSGDTAALEVIQSSSVRTMSVVLNRDRPRLGAVCDLTGYRKQGVTAAGNESQTVFEGPYSLTASGIIDKGIVFIRVRLTNNSDQTLSIGPGSFSAKDGMGQSIAILSATQVMCTLFGERGARMLISKDKKKQSADTDITTSLEHPNGAICESGMQSGRLKSDLPFIEANADYLSKESLWTASYAPSQTADGLLYANEHTAWPMTLQASLGGRELTVTLGTQLAPVLTPAVSEKNLESFLKAQKKGTPLRVVLKKGNVFVGRFSSYDAVEEMVWFDTPSGGLMNVSSMPLRSIANIQPVDSAPKASPAENIN